jgi:putative membrane protein insertion efficiency factor
MKLINSIFSKIIIGMVLVYRYSFSPIVGKNCRFQPTCSQYAMDAISTHGPWRGLWLALKRLGRCHPWQSLGSGSGYDPVPSFATTKHLND